jgi:hypothetical protein
MSCEGLTRRRKRRFIDDDDSGEMSSFWNMSDVVFSHLSCYLTDWYDHRRLACSKASLWRYYRTRDPSTCIMFFFYKMPVSKEVSHQFIVESGDARCMQWLWNRKLKTTLSEKIAPLFCFSAAIHGRLDLIRHYGTYLNDATRPMTHNKVLRRLCRKAGNDQVVMSYIERPLHISDATQPKSSYFASCLLNISPCVHNVPETFQMLLHSIVADTKDDKFDDIIAVCLVPACIEDGFDIEGFKFLWKRKSDSLDEATWINRFFMDAVIFIQAHLDDTGGSINVLRRLPVLLRCVFADHCIISKEADNSVKWSCCGLALNMYPPNERGVVLVAMSFYAKSTRFSYGFDIPESCL